MTPQPKRTTRTAAAPPVFVPPYPPSWIDRLMAWVDRLPGPAWAFYLILGMAAGLGESALQWWEGAYPVGTFNSLHVWTAGHFAYVLGLIHLLDTSAGSALASFRPLLVSEEDGKRPSPKDELLYARISYELTTLPTRPTLLATLGGAAWAVFIFGLQLSSGPTPLLLAGTSGSALSTASVMALLVLGNAASGVLVYHTIRQLAQISRIYSHHARINIYQLQPLYSLSVPGALTAVGMMLFTYIWFATSTSMTPVVGFVEIGLSVVFAVIAAATFGLPLAGAHRRLVAEKNRRLAEAAARFEAASEELHRELDGRRLVHMDHLNKALASLELEQNAVRRAPTWPWEPGALRGLIAALLLPIVIWLIQYFLSRWLGA
jgi:hypothetical protein